MIQYSGTTAKKHTPRKKKSVTVGKAKTARGGVEMRLLVLEGKLAVRDNDIARLEQQLQVLTRKIERIARAERVVSAFSTFLEEILSLRAER